MLHYLLLFAIKDYMIDKKEIIIKNLQDFIFLLQINNDNIFKIKAMQNALEIIHPLDLEVLQNPKELSSIKGIGKGIQNFIEQSFMTEPSELTALKEQIPISLLELTCINGLGVKRIKKLWQELDIKNLGELEYACKENRLAIAKGFGEKMQQNILQSILEHNSNKLYLRLDEALSMSNDIIEILSSVGYKKIAIANPVCAKEEIVNNLSFVILTTDNLEDIFNKIKNINNIKINQKNSNLKYKNIDVNLFICKEENNFTLTKLFHTSPANFWHLLQQKAKELSLELDKISFNDEKEIFALLQIPYIEVEYRHRITNLSNKNKTIKLIKLEDLQGAFHNHTVYSDGVNTIKEMREEAIKLGLKYISINDHSTHATYAQGLLADTLTSQLQEIAKINKDEFSQKCFIFSGTESDILANGLLDYEENLLQKLDIIIASIHTRFKQNYDEMTERLIAALNNPYTSILGHRSEEHTSELQSH